MTSRLQGQRVFDLVVATAALVATAPVAAGVAVAVWLDGDGDVLFRQSRVGRHFEPFEILKFKTMDGAPSPGGARLAVEEEHRTRRLGRFLRRTRLDELPQLWNVLRGDMSVVGPRPELPELAALVRDRYEALVATRPGLVDPAFVQCHALEAGLSGTDDPRRAYVEDILPMKLTIAERYLAERSVIGDLRCVARALLAIAQGAR